MSRWTPALCLSILVLSGCDEGTLIEPEEPTTALVSSPLQYLVNPGDYPARTDLGQNLLALAVASAEGEDGADDDFGECVTVDFEGVGDQAEVGSPTGSGITFGTSWIGLIDSDDGGTGPIANEPSSITVGLTWDDVDADIVLDAPAAYVSLWYSATESALPLTLEGLDAEGQVVVSAVGTTVGYADDGADCVGDPTGLYCLWDQLSIDTDEASIVAIRISGTPMVFAIDDLEVCGVSDDSDDGSDGDLAIDIKPGNDQNPVNPKSNGKIPVGVFGSEELDVAEIDLESITLGDGEDDETGVALKGGGRPMAQMVDLNQDGFADLMLHFDVGQLVENGDLDWGTEELTLMAALLDEDDGGEETGEGETGAAQAAGEDEEGEDGEEEAERLSGTDRVRIVGSGGDDGGEDDSGEDDDGDEEEEEGEDAGTQDQDDEGNGKKDGNKGKGKKKGHDKRN